ncbi:SDR family NAD(P)-dependent oxidoreductase [Pendulispora rubella]|uniref:SDR family NAD(P)-dependent oxidoreductase n=1 Tax=Pendulispora rubella TaxID=2741070 RepID=A0ABZ2L7V4_9BACT
MGQESPSQTKLREALVRSLREVERLRDRLATYQAASSEPLAIIGMGLRVPGGVVDLESFWNLLASGGDAIRPVPEDRWNADEVYDPDPDAKDKSYVREAAFLDRIDLFDAAFFGISPREAKNVDPRHRLLLEASWHALEDAGVVPGALKDSQTGVFVGIGPGDYDFVRGPADEAEAYVLTGSQPSFAAGRLAFTLGLQGPALSVDTACSSSLVALHLACQALRRGECQLALAGGVQVMAAAEGFVMLSRTRALAPDGRSKTFAESADGYGRGEGVIVLALERLDDARAHGRRILAVVRGTAVNHDGASSGITAPNGTSQQKVLRAALEDARLRAADVDVVECHGTGTALGDPIEVQALAAVYGEGREEGRPLLLGAVKTNIGHLESAAGLAGVAKVIACLRYGALPPTLHTNPRNRHIDWDALPVRVVDTVVPWGGGDRLRRAGVSAFGLSGTNVHVIVEEAPALPHPSPPPGGEGAVMAFSLSAKTEGALLEQGARLGAYLDAHPEARLVDVAYSLATTRSHFEWRAAFVARDREQVREALANLAPHHGHGSKKLALLFTGQGSQWAGMGRASYDAFPVFRDALDAVCAQLDPHLERPLRDVLFFDEERIHATGFTQPALFALEVALFRLLESWGLRPDVLLGHSIGEIVAAHVAGVFSLEDVCTLVAARARLLQALPAGGAMMAIQATEDDVRPRLRGRVDVAGINAPNSTVVAGEEAAVVTVAEHFQALGRKTTRLRVSHAFHSPLVEPMLDDFRRVAEKLVYHAPRIPIVSNATGARAEARDIASAEYWVRHVRQAVRFLDGVRTLHSEGATTFLELGPHGVLTPLAQACLDEIDGLTFVPTMQKDRGVDAIVSALGAIHARGHHVDWEAFFAPHRPSRRTLPTYPFQGERYWVDSGQRQASSLGSPAGRYALAGRRFDLPDGSVLHTIDIGPSVQPYLRDHLVYGRIVVPGAFYVAILLAVAESHWPDQPLELRQVEFLRPISFERATECVTLHLQLARGASGFSVRLCTRQDDAWTTHVTATLDVAPLAPAAQRASLRPPAEEPASLGYLDVLRALQIEWGPQWRWLRQASRVRERVAVGRLAAPEGVGGDDAPIPGGLIDNVFGLEIWSAGLPATGEVPRLPFAIERVVWYGRHVVPTWAEHALVTETTEGAADADVTHADMAFWDSDGVPVAHIEGFSTRRAPAAQFFAAQASSNLYALVWREIPAPASPAHATWAIVDDDPLGLVGAATGARAYLDVNELGRAVAQGMPLPDVVAIAFGSGEADTPDVPERAHRATHRLLATLQAWFADEVFAPCRLVVLTRGAVAARTEDTVDLVQAPLWGLARSAQLEHPGRPLTLLDVDALDAKAARAAVSLAEPQLALRQGTLRVPRLIRAAASSASGARSLDPNGTVLVTGATGGLGAELARHLVIRHGVRHLLLLSRRGPEAPLANDLVAELQAAGARVTLRACDVGRADELAQCLEHVAPEHPLTAVVHAAGILDDKLLASLSQESLDAVLAPKLDAAWHLHRLTGHLDLRAFVLFSSFAGVLGGPGQANYAAANAALDGLAVQRNALGLPGCSLAWGPWDGTGMAARLPEADRARLRRQGLVPFSAEEALALFDAAVARPEPLLVPVCLDAAALAARGDSLPPMLRDLARASVRRVEAPARQGEELARRLGMLEPAERLRAVLDVVRQHVGAVLDADPHALEPSRPLQELGLDSLMAVELRNRLASATGLRLPATLLFDHPSPAALTHLLLEQLLPDASKENGPSMLAMGVELDRVESTLTELHANEAMRETLTHRLRALLSRWAGGPNAAAEVTFTKKIDAAGVDELLHILDQKFGDNAHVSS